MKCGYCGGTDHQGHCTCGRELPCSACLTSLAEQPLRSAVDCFEPLFGIGRAVSETRLAGARLQPLNMSKFVRQWEEEKDREFELGNYVSGQ